MAEYVEILMVEDDPGDADLTQELLEDAKVLIHVNVVEDGVKAMDYLRQQGNYAQAVRPDLILLDLNLPRKDGREVLQEIKSDPDLKRIPVVVLTTSDADEDILRSYNLGANSFVTKPVGLDQFAHIVKTIENFWFTVVKFPPK
ncbi:response regulator [Candidatus Leptofilum sp.]|uniref:response regulator n=1 Tax=Candidatus Leptofilum sp. TaxID=3241576 RepID=UPI003B5CA80B